MELGVEGLKQGAKSFATLACPQGSPSRKRSDLTPAEAIVTEFEIIRRYFADQGVYRSHLCEGKEQRQRRDRNEIVAGQGSEISRD